MAGQGAARRSSEPKPGGPGLESHSLSPRTYVRGTRRMEEGEADINYALAVSDAGYLGPSIGSLT